LLYEDDLSRCPAYHDGTPRKPWRDLGDVEQWSWKREQNVRDVAIKAGADPDAVVRAYANSSCVEDYDD
jgi:hypothetical protein